MRQGFGRCGAEVWVKYMSSELSILIVEDQALDAELLEHELRRIGLKLNSLRVYTRSAMETAVREFRRALQEVRDRPVPWDQCFG
jgi:hypothetical protein